MKPFPFILMICGLLAVVFLLHWQALRQVFPERWARRLQRLSLAAVLFTALGLVLGPLVFREPAGLPGVLLQVAVVIFVTEVLLILLDRKSVV